MWGKSVVLLACTERATCRQSPAHKLLNCANYFKKKPNHSKICYFVINVCKIGDYLSVAKRSEWIELQCFAKLLSVYLFTNSHTLNLLKKVCITVYIKSYTFSHL